MSKAALAGWTLAFPWVLALAILQLLPPLAQDPAYHDFAPTGELWGLPHAGNVLTNLAFVLPGLLGLARLGRGGGWQARPTEAVFFLGLILTGVGSGAYHYAPTNLSLAWDRLPMTIAFMALFTALIGDCLAPRLARALLPIAVAAGALSVLHWVRSEASGAGDLRYYALVQYLPILMTPWILLRWPPRTLRGGALWLMLALYLVAKACELLDRPLAELLPGSLTGHALKHLFAGAAGFAFLAALPAHPEEALQRPAR